MVKTYNSKMLPLFFYGSLADKLSERAYVNGELPGAYLLCPKNTLIDFQIQRASLPDTITEFKVFTDNDVEYLDLATALTTITTVTNDTVNFDVISYSNHELAADSDCGIYYIYITDGTLEWYSEDFKVGNFDKGFDSNFAIGRQEATNILLCIGLLGKAARM